MKKQNIIEEKKRVIARVTSLQKLNDEIWFGSFHEKEWGPADVISHFITWDNFVITKRLNYILYNKAVPSFSIDVEKVNKRASLYARSKVKEEIIEEFTSTRLQLVKLISEIPEEWFSQPLPGKEIMTLGQYFMELINHDLKHMKQIELFIKKQKKQRI